MKDLDVLYKRALKVALTTGKANTAHLQRHLHIGYSTASELGDLLEKRGVVGAYKSGVREVFMDEVKRQLGASPKLDLAARLARCADELKAIAEELVQE